MLTIKILEIILRNTLINFNRLKQIPACNITLSSVFFEGKTEHQAAKRYSQ